MSAKAMDAHDTPPARAVDNEGFVDRIAGAAERLMAAVEVRLRAGDGEAGVSAADRERDARTLASIVRLYEKVITLRAVLDDAGTARRAMNEGDREPRNIDDMRSELAKLFARLAEEADAEPDHQRTDPGADRISE